MLRRGCARRPGSAREDVLAKFVVGVATAAAMLVVFEGALRVVWRYGGTADFGVTALENRNDPSATRIVLPSSVAAELGSSQRFGVQSNILTYPDRRLLFRVRPNPTLAPVYCYEGIDADGFRTGGALDTFRRRPRSSAARVLVLGDSCAFGWDICRLDQTVGPQLATVLREHGRSAAVVSLAQPGYSTAQGLLLFRRWFPELRPDFVVLYFGWNDRYPAPGLTDTQLLRLVPVAGSSWAQSVMSSALYKTFAWIVSPVLARSRERARGEHVRVPLEESAANVKAMTEAANAAGARVVIVMPAHGPQFSHKDLIIDGFNHAVGDAVAGEAALVRLPAMETGTADAAGYFTRDGYHPNPRGARYVAERIAAAMDGGSDDGVAAAVEHAAADVPERSGPVVATGGPSS